MTDEERFYIGDLERELERGRSTIRQWERYGWPSECEAKRDEKGWRYWTREQLEFIRVWMGTRNASRVNHSIRRRRARRA